MADNTAVILFPKQTDPTTLGALEVDVLVESEIGLSSDVTEFPVETGFPIHDHVVRKPIRLHLVVIFTNTPVTWYERRGGNSPVRLLEAAAELQLMYEKGVPVTISSYDYIFENMVITDAKIPKNTQDGRIVRATLEFTQVRIVNTKQTNVPAELTSLLTQGRAGETEQNGGSADATTSSTSDTSANSSDSSASSGSSDSASSSTESKGTSVLKGFFG